MFHANALLCIGIRPARYVAGRIDARYAGLQIGIDTDPAIDGESCLLRQLQIGTNADSQNHQIGCSARRSAESPGRSSTRATEVPR